jgi:hypothetical protein
MVSSNDEVQQFRFFPMKMSLTRVPEEWSDVMTNFFPASNFFDTWNPISCQPGTIDVTRAKVFFQVNVIDVYVINDQMLVYVNTSFWVARWYICIPKYPNFGILIPILV